MKKKIQKPFDIEVAKNGAKVETKGGKPARIVCYDRKGKYPIIALINNCKDIESCHSYNIKGKLRGFEDTNEDLVIVEEVEEAKFNVGDWVVRNTNVACPWLITARPFDYYELQDADGLKTTVSQITIDKKYHLWTLKDANPGDVLITEDDKHPFIFKEFLGHAPSAYCGIDTTDSIYIASDAPWTRTTVRPATSNEKDMLFKKMEEEGYKWDAESLTVSKIQKRWRDNEYKTISDYYTHTDSCIIYSEDHSNTKENYNLFATEKQVKSALAMARISQIMANDERFGGIVTDEEWSVNTWRYVIVRMNNDLLINLRHEYEYLAFHTKEQAKLFLKENKDLVKDYYMMD